MARKKKAAAAGAPEWMVTFGDMMSLLLCFFVIIVSMSEQKQDRRFQEVMDSLRMAFGHQGRIGVVPTLDSSKNSLVEQLKRVVLIQQTKKEGDSDEEGIEGKVVRVTDVREGINLEVGGRVTFERFKADLKPEARALIGGLVSKVIGHNTIIKVRGHATLEALPADSPFRDAMELSYARARAVADTLVDFGIRSGRLRIEAAGNHAPLVRQAYEERRRALNRRVEIIVTEAIVDDFAGQLMGTEERVTDHGSR